MNYGRTAYFASGCTVPESPNDDTVRAFLLLLSAFILKRIAPVPKPLETGALEEAAPPALPHLPISMRFHARNDMRRAKERLITEMRLTPPLAPVLRTCTVFKATLPPQGRSGKIAGAPLSHAA